MRTGPIPGSYIVGADANRVYQVAQAVRELGFEVEDERILIFKHGFFSVNGVSEESLEAIKAIEGVTSLEQEHYITAFGTSE